MKPSPIDGGRVLITGASAGIGRELARLVAPRARALVLVARRRGRLDELAAELSARHPSLRVEIHACDLGDPAATAALADAVISEDSVLDVLVNNAGASRHAFFDQIGWEEADAIVRINVTAPIHLTHRFLPGMYARRRGGLLFIGSGAGLTPLVGEATYSASKHFQHGLAETLRLELRGGGVRVTEVCPGPVTTEFDEVAGISGGAALSGVRIDAVTCARESVAGFDRSLALVYPGRAYGMLMRLREHIPMWAQRWLMAAGTPRKAPR